VLYPCTSAVDPQCDRPHARHVAASDTTKFTSIAVKKGVVKNKVIFYCIDAASILAHLLLEIELDLYHGHQTLPPYSIMVP